MSEEQIKMEKWQCKACQDERKSFKPCVFSTSIINPTTPEFCPWFGHECEWESVIESTPIVQTVSLEQLQMAECPLIEMVNDGNDKVCGFNNDMNSCPDGDRNICSLIEHGSITIELDGHDKAYYMKCPDCGWFGDDRYCQKYGDNSCPQCPGTVKREAEFVEPEGESEAVNDG